MIDSTIIIPTFNQDVSYLRAALLSARHQTMKCEIVVVDDGSHPNQEQTVADIMEGYGKETGLPCKYIYQENRGVAGALNRGIEESTGRYIQWLPSDDLFALNKTEEQFKLLESVEGIVSYSAYEEGVPITATTWPAAQYPTQEKFFPELLKHCFVNAATVMFNRDIIEMIGLFNTDMVHCQDYEYLLRMAEHVNFHAINLPLVRRRVHEGQMLQTLKDPKEREKKERDMQYIKNRYGATGHVWLPN